MQQPNDPIAVEKVTRALKGRILRAAIAHTDKIDSRSALALEQSGIFTRTSMPPPPAHLLSILDNSTHPDRIGSALGPTLFYREGENTRYAMEMEYLLLTDDPRTRKAAWNYFDDLRISLPGCMTDTTYSVLKSVQGEIAVDDRQRWRGAALKAYDALYSDIRFTLAGVKQAVLGKFEDGLKKYVPRLLRPAIKSLEQLGLPFVRPSQEHEKIRTAIILIADSEASIGQKCDVYVEQLGFLPLGNQLSFSFFAETLVRRAPNSGDAIKQLWTWATDSRDPLARYHVAVALLEHSNWISEIGSRALLESLVSLLEPAESKEERGNERQASLSFRDELAKYYLNYLELTLPESMGEILATWAWWLAHHVGNIFLSSNEILDRFRNVALIPERQEVDVAWRLANAKVVPSRLSVATHWPASLWDLALSKRLTVENLKALKHDTPDAALETLAIRLTPCLLFGDLPTTEPSTDDTYLFEGGLTPSIDAWAQVQGPSDRLRFWQELTASYKDLNDTTRFIDKLRNAPQSEVVEQIILSHAGRRLSIEGKFPVEQMFEAMKDKVWRQQLFLKLDLAALELIASVFIWAAVDSGDKWRFTVAHLLATICEEVDPDEDRRDLLFSLLLCACITSYSMAAIERLLKGRSRQKYIDAARKWSATLTDLNSSGPRWIGARGRGAHAAIGACLSINV